MTRQQSFLLIAATGAALLIVSWRRAPDSREAIATSTSDAPAERAPAAAPAQDPRRASDLNQEIAQLLKGGALDAAERTLLSTPDVNSWERALKASTIARRHPERFPGGDDLGGEIVQRMKSDPRAAADAIRSLLQKMPAEAFPIDRASLIDVAGDLPEMRAEAKRIAIQELDSVIARKKTVSSEPTDEELDRVLTSDPRDFLPMVSHSVLMRTADSGEEALSLTVAAVSRQVDEGMRSVLAQQFTDHFPQLEEPLKSELSKAGIVLKAPQEN